MKRIKEKLQKFLFSSLEAKDVKKFTLLSFAFAFVIGAYWIVRALKNVLMQQTVGVSSIPMAKKISVLVVIFLLIVYTKLIDKISTHKLFYIMSGFYIACFGVISYLFSCPEIVAAHKWIGFASYSLIESFGSLMVALFWLLVSTSVDISSAKKGFAIIFASGQIGALLGLSLVSRAEYFGIPLLIAVSALVISVIPFIIHKFVELVADEVDSDEKKKSVILKKRAGLFEGIKLLLTRPYVFGIFLIMMLYEIVVTIFDYQMQILADSHYSATSYAAFNAFYGQLVTLIACGFAFFGTRFFINRLGFRFCLLLFPTIIACLVGLFYFVPSLWVALSCMVTIKAMSYGFNNPIKEIIYLPTSEQIKLRAKSWIEMFGNRSSKAGGATINGALGSLSNGFVEYAVVISLAAIGAWIIVAIFMGHRFTRLVKERKIVR